MLTLGSSISPASFADQAAALSCEQLLGCLMLPPWLQRAAESTFAADSKCASPLFVTALSAQHTMLPVQCEMQHLSYSFCSFFMMQSSRAQHCACHDKRLRGQRGWFKAEAGLQEGEGVHPPL